MSDTDKLHAADINDLAKGGMTADQIVEYLREHGIQAEIIERGYYPVGIKINEDKVVYPPSLQ